MTAAAVFLFPMIMTLISLAATVLIIMFIIRGVTHGQSMRKQAFDQALAKGIYDRSLLASKSKGIAPLGWGIFFTALGIAMIIGFASLGILSEAATGALIPLFVGVGLIVYYRLTKDVRESERNGKPIEIPPSGTITKIDDEESGHGGV
ncbi:MAG: hypothetical protein GF405_09170 [Candidatus Eisenbacteria bacterium]|nr:hypothetical protein [Candidatus Eisenbacteria bacterium]